MKQSLSVSLQELADYLEVTLEGDPKCQISGLATLENAKAGQLSFLTNRSYRGQLASTKASAVLLGPEDAELSPVPVLISNNPRLTLARIAGFLETATKRPLIAGIHSSLIQGQNCRIHPSASIEANVVLGDNVEISEGVRIGAGSVIGSDSCIGPDSIIKPKVVLYERVKIGKNSTIHSGTVIGCDGFGYAMQGDSWIRMPHLAGVSIGDSVEIGANCEIDRGFIEDTSIGNGAIIGSLVVVGHNVIIGDHTAIAGCSGIAGSSTIGKRCILGGGVSIGGHLKITDGVHITATTAIHQSIDTPGVYSSGVPATANSIWRRNAVRFQYLDDMAKRLKVLEKKLEALEHNGVGE